VSSGKAAAREERARGIARALSVSADELATLRSIVARAESGIIETGKGKASLVTRRLGVTPPELKMLRRGLAGDVTSRAVVNLIVRQVLRGRSQPGAVSGGRRASTSRMRRSGASRRPRSMWAASTQVFITPYGHAVHLYSDCHLTRGFRLTGERDCRGFG